jgi:hypothetical protein
MIIAASDERFVLVDIDQRVLQGKISKATITTKHGTLLPSPKIRREQKTIDSIVDVNGVFLR